MPAVGLYNRRQDDNFFDLHDNDTLYSTVYEFGSYFQPCRQPKEATIVEHLKSKHEMFNILDFQT